MIICYHGTNAEAAQSIFRTGFKVGTWFAAHLEDAIAYGGLHVFKVAFEDNVSELGWQFHVLTSVSRKNIVSYSVYQQHKVFENDNLRKLVFESKLK